MKFTMPVFALVACSCAGFWASAADDPPTFEAASVKPSPPPGGGEGFFRVAMDGGPGTEDPTRIDYRNVSLGNLITRAYDISHWQLSGQDRLTSELYDITARVAPGTTKEQFRLMLQNLLRDRFKLQVHREEKELPLYSLAVVRGGSRMKLHVDAPTPDDGSDKPLPDNLPGRIKTDSDGYPILSSGITMATMNGRARIRIENVDLLWLVGMLSAQLGAPVNDVTGLTGKYDVQLLWSTRPPDATSDTGPDLFAAVQEQLGLKLEKKKGPVEMLIVDHADKVPSSN